MKFLVKYVFLLLSCVMWHFVQAQASDTAKQWSIEDCFQYATKHNIQINTLRLNEQSTIQDLSAAKGIKIPNLSASVSNTFNNANNSASGNGILVNQLTSNGNYTLNSSMILWNDNYINNNIRQRELLTQSAGLSVNQSLSNLINDNNIFFIIKFYIMSILKVPELMARPPRVGKMPRSRL